ncbi:MAG TPA: hypothetical protein VNA04_04705 [Thermoanaerobaculia bacterium]|nr:hypothetical protein [Thermoanaerobaculia bacterium]
MTRLRALCVLLLTAVTIEAQGPSADWQTVSTPHFHVHFPSEYEAWSLRAASRLESIRAAVVREIGYDPPERIDVIVANPIAQPNGLAWPLLDTPRIVLFTEPPGPDEQIGAYSDWIDLLAVHEVAHVVHMLRPSRNPAQRFVERFILPLNRITLASPRWVLEGYATVVEGRLTGAGRPSSTARALILRQWAAHGRLPPYNRLDSDSRFLGMSMAYLVGSAYLEWLEQRSGPDSLRKLWTRMTARRRRSFEEAFTGVFGQSPDRLYGEFFAEVTASALAANSAAPIREGELWQETSRGSGDPAVSPDGERIALVLRERSKPARLVVWSTGPAAEEEKRDQERLANIREADPEDVPPVRVRPLPREPLHSLIPPGGGDLLTPRWMPGGRSILYAQRQPDAEGFLHHDLFVWTPDTGTIRRVTSLADVREADPLPDGRTAVAVQSRHGFSRLVMVDLAGGAVRPLTERSLQAVYSHPRVDRDGKRIVYVANRGGVWSLVVRDLGSGAESVVNPPEPGDAYAWPEWDHDGSGLVATILSRGFAELYRAGLGATPVPLTRTSGGAMQAAPAPDGRIFFMSLEPDGFVVRVIDGERAAPPPPLDEALVPAVPPRPAAAAAFATQALPPAEPYGIGRQEIGLIMGQTLAPSQNATEAGVRIGDVAGRLDTIVLASLGVEDAQRGIGAASAWRGWPVEVSGHIFHAEDRRGDRRGLELRASWERHAPRSRLLVEGGVLAGEPLDLGFVETRFRTFRVSRRGTFTHELSAAYDSGTFRQFRGRYRGTFRHRGARLTVAYDRRLLDGAEDGGHRIEVGGLPSSIIPRSAFAGRVFEPAVAAAALRGARYEGRRVETVVPGVPLSLFYQQHRLDGSDLEIAGAEVTMASDPMPLARLPGFDATIGVARVLSGPIPHDTSWWVGLRWRP